jgi:hypothetical protein
MAQAEPSRPVPERADAWRALAIFGAVGLALAAFYLGSVVVFADASVLRSVSAGGVERLARFNASLGLVFAYLVAALWLGKRWVHRDFEALRGVVEAGDHEWSAWRERLRLPVSGGVLGAALLGALAGLVVDWVGRPAGDSVAGVWRGHLLWIWTLNPLLFAAMGVLVRLSADRARVFRELGRRVRVRLGEVAPLAPFARAGLRTALLWFVGTSLASLLLVDTDAPALVLSILVATTAIAVFSLLAPSRGVHERLREAKREELDWLRGEIAHSSDALRRGDAAGAALLPALLAWEARIAGASEWPFDTSTWLRFALLLLVPLGSWLGGALVEHVVERWLGA